LIIKALSKTGKKVTKQIKEVEIICKIHDKTSGNIYLDKSLNFHKTMKSLFLFYADNKLISILSIFMPTEKEAEISAYTLPDYRQKGYFKKLLNDAIEELKKYKCVRLLLVCEPQSKDGKSVIKKLRARLDFTEYCLRFKGYTGSLDKKHFSQIRLHEADLSDLEAIAGLSRQIFNCNYKDSKSVISKSLKDGSRTQYIAILDGNFIGIVAVSFDNDEASIFGLGISPQHQGKGYGKELLNLILEDLKKKDIKNVFIEVDSTNKNAFNLYLKCGFEVETSYDYHRKYISNYNWLL